ncbi:hypothetical protein AVEN_15665-1 [Araneus ventricosus]|uniref:Uncharacterized protein n=1 Tax=Araneus ventricosus TaxID=182803 RepID=A0A4Y2K5U6_ARAVE|nr:hypothetical protein AVEN_15665-1 [Araneus ventricosus]
MDIFRDRLPHISGIYVSKPFSSLPISFYAFEAFKDIDHDSFSSLSLTNTDCLHRANCLVAASRDVRDKKLLELQIFTKRNLHWITAGRAQVGNQQTGYLALPCHPGLLNDSRCNSSSIEAGVLVAITGHGPNPPVGGTYYHWWRDPSPAITIPQGKREPAYLSGGFSLQPKER